MARKPSEEKLREYDSLKRFFVHWLMVISPLPHRDLSDPIHPLNVLAEFEQKLPFSRVLAGLQQAVNDSLESTEDWTADRIRLADASLQEAGAPRLSLLLARRAKTYRKILRRGRILNDSEFYLVSAAIADTANPRAAEELAPFGSMLAAYEARA